MAKITGEPLASGMPLYASSSVAINALDLGQRVKGTNGTEFRYVKAGASALVVGNVVQSSAYGTAQNALAVQAAASVGDMYITITNSSTTQVANYFADGTLTIDTTPGLGQTFTIASHEALTNAGTHKIYLKEPVRVALTTSSKVTLRKNPADGVIQSPATTLTGSVVGVAIYPIPAGEYGFVQTRGVAATLSDATSIIMGSAVSVPSGTAGAMTLNVAGTAIIGRAMQAASDAETIPVDLYL